MNYSQHRNDFESAILDSKLSSNQKLVALALKSHMNNDDGRCFPSIKTLAAECSLSEKTVRNAIKELEVAGFITKVVAGNGRGKSTHYNLHPIQSDVDNLNKHKGNTSTLTPNYSPTKDINPSDFHQADFDVELPIHATIIGTYDNTPDVTECITRADHLRVLKPTQRQSALNDIENVGWYFNEYYKKWLDAEGNETITAKDDF